MQDSNSVPTQTFTSEETPLVSPYSVSDSDVAQAESLLKQIGNTPEPSIYNPGKSNNFLFGKSVAQIFAIAAILISAIIGAAAIGVLHSTGGPGKSGDGQKLLASAGLSEQKDGQQQQINNSVLQINRTTVINKNFTAGGEVLIQSGNDSAEAFKIQNSSGNNLLVADTKNNQITVGNQPPGNVSLSVNGDITTNGALVSTAGYSLSSQGLTIGNVLVCTANGCVSSSSPPPTPASPSIDVANLVFLNKNQTFSGSKTFNASTTFNAPIQVAGNVNSTAGFSVGGVAGGSFSCAANELLQQAVISGGIITSGNCVTVAGGTTPSLQDVYDASLPASVVLSNASGVFNIQDAASPLATNLFEVGSNGNSTLYFAVNNLGISVTGNVNTTGQYQVGGSQISSANLSNDANLAKLNAAQTFSGANTFSNASNSFSGSGAGLTSLNATNVSSGTLNDLRLSANVTKQGNTFNGASQLVQLTAGGILPVLNGSNLTSLNAGNISSGTLNDGRLSANVALLNANNIFLGNDSFHLNSTALSVQDAASPLGTNLFEVDSNGGATKYFEVSAAGVKVNGNAVCTAAGNCTGVAGGSIGGSGTTGKIAKFTGSGFTIGDSLLSESGSVVAVNGSINIATGNTYQINGSQISSANLSNDANLAKLNAAQTFSGANTFSNASNSFTGNGSGLSNVDAAKLNGQPASYYTDASNISSGTLNDARLSGNVALKNGNNTFTGNNVFSLNTAGLAVQDALTPLGTNLFEVTNNTGTTKYFTVSATALQFNGNDVCTTGGNCTGVAGGSIGGSGTAGKIAKFTGSGFTVGDSLISDNGSTVTVGGTLAVNTITPTATLTIGTPTQTLSLQGDGSTSLSASSSGITNKLVFALPGVSNKTITIPNASGTVAVSASGPLALDAAGNLTCPTCLTGGGGGGSGVSSLNTLSGDITLAGTADQVIITPVSNTLTFSLPQSIATTSTPDFAGIDIGGSQISSAALSNDSNLAKLNAAQTFSGANTFSNASNSFTGDGSGLTSLNASNVSSGTLNDGRLSSNVALLNRTGQIFTGDNTIKTASSGAFQVQNAGGVSLFTVDSQNNKVIVKDVVSESSLGSELAGSTVCSGTNWSGAGPWTHAAGSATALTCNPPASTTIGNQYQLVFTVSGMTAGSITPHLGFSGTVYSPIDQNVANETETYFSSDGSGLSFVPSSDFNGVISNISVKLLTINNPAIQLQNSDGSAGLEIRSGGIGIFNSFVGRGAGQSIDSSSSNNSGFGAFALNSNTSGTYNTATGAEALGGNTTGSFNTANGAYSLEFNSTGESNSAFGDYTLFNNNIGTRNTAIGNVSLENNTSGSGNTGVGSGSLFSNITGSNNTALGRSAGDADPLVSSFATLSNLQNATMVGYGAEAQASNSLILGGAGANAVNVGIGTTSPTNLFSVSPDIYDTGTASTAASATVVGSGTTWTANMVGMEFLFANGNKYTVTGFTDATHMTLSASSTNASQAYRVHNPAFFVSSTGQTQIRTSTNSATAFQVQNAAGNNVLAVDTTANQVVLGKASAINGTLSFANSAGSNTVSLVSQAVNPASSVTIQLPTVGASGAGQCVLSDTGSTTTNSLLKFGACATGTTSQTKVVAMGTATGCTGSSPVASLDTNADYIVTSCTSAQTTINTAITALGTTGGTVYLKEGTYIVDGAINMASNVTLAGSGPGTVLKLKDGINAAINMVSASSLTRVGIRDLRLDGNQANNTSGAQRGINGSTLGSGSGTTAVTGIKINNISADNFRTDGVFLGSTINSSVQSSSFVNNISNGVSFNGGVPANNVISGNKFMGNNTGVGIVNGTNNVVSENAADGNVSNGISITGASSANNTITGNTVGNTSGAGAAGIAITSGVGHTVSSNIISNSSYGISISASNITVSGNSISGTTTAGILLNSGTGMAVTSNNLTSNTGVGGAIWVNNTTDSSISGNTLMSNSTGILSTSDRINITGNTIANSTSIGVWLNGSNSSVVSGNLVKGNAGSGIRLDSASANNQINANRIYDNGGVGANDGISLLTSGGTGNSLVGNQITDTAGTGFAIKIGVASFTNTYLSNNTFSGTGATSISDSGTGTIYANQVNANGDFVFDAQRGVAIGSLTASSSLSLQGAATLVALPAVAQPTVTATLGSATTWGYKITALDGLGETAGSTERTIANGAATLDATHFNTITWTPVGGAINYKIYRTTAAGTPASTGLIGTVAGNITSFVDNGIAATTAVPATNSSGGISVQGNATFKPTTDSATAFQVQNAGGASILTADTSGNKIQVGSSTTDNVAVLNVLDSYNQATDPTGTNGAMYYNSNTNKFRCFENGVWANCVGGTALTLQNVYDNSSSPATILTSSPTKGILLKAGTGFDSSGLLQIQNSTGGSLLNVDSQYSNITLLGNNDGQVGPWTTQGSNLLTAARRGSTSVTANGYVYVIGGYSSNVSSSTVNTVYYAKLNADGSTGAWNSANNLPASVGDASSVVYNGYAYVFGGYNGATTQNTAYYAKLNADGSTGSWINQGTNLLPANRMNANSVVLNGYAYVMGGLASNGGAAQNSVYYAKLNADGSTGAWNSTTSFAALTWASAVTANGYIYVMGGWNAAVYQSSVYYAKPNSDGTITSWTTSGNPLPGSAGKTTAVVSNGYVYVIGGEDGSGPKTTIYSAKLNSNSSGATSVWSSQAANQLVSSRRFATSIISNGYVYVIGGQDSANTTQTSIYYASAARVQIGANLDLVGLQGQTLADAGDGSAGSTGGSITAGNITAVGALQVQGQGSFNQGLSANGNLSIGGYAAFRNSADSPTAFQVQNAAGNNVLAVDTTANQVVLGKASAINGTLSFANSAGSNTVSLVSQAVNPASSVIIQLPTVGASGAGQCVLSDTGSTTTNSLLKFGACATGTTSQTKVVAMGSPTGCIGSVPVASLDTNADYVVNSCTSAQTTINTAITALGSTGGTVYLKEGTYIVDGAINMASNVTLAGSGPGTVLKLKDGINASVNLISISSKNRVGLRDFKLDGNQTNQTAGTQYGVSLATVGSGSGAAAIPGMKASNLSVENFRSDGLIAAGMMNSSISNSTLLNNGGAGISLWVTGGSSDNNTIVNNNVQGNSLIGIDIEKGINNTVTGNTLQGNISDGVRISANNNTVSSNTITANGEYGVYSLSHNDNTISGNNISANAGYGILINAASRNTATGNNIASNGNNGIWLANGSANTVSGNNIYNNSGSGVFSQSDDATIIGNTISTNTSRALYVNSADRQLITGNTVTGNAAEGIYIFTSNDDVISNNLVKSNASMGIHLDFGVSNSLINSNRVYDNGGVGSSSGIDLQGGSSSNNVISNNKITDTAGTGFAIRLSSINTTQPINTTLAGNTYSGTGAASISDGGTGTIYANQVNANGDFVFDAQRGLAVGTLTASSSFSLQGAATLTPLTSVAQPTVTKTGTSGTTTWGYEVTALDGLGETAGSTEKTLTTGNATLDGTNFNTITWAAVGGAVQYKIYRTTAGGTPATTGLIGTVSSSVLTFNDTGLAATTAVPTTNSSGGISVQGNATFKPTTDSATAFQVQNAAGNLLLSVGNSGTTTTNYINDDMVTNTPTGTLLNSATYVAGNYVQLNPASSSTNGEIEYTPSLPSSNFDASFQFFAGGGSGADGTFFYAYNTSTPTSGGSATGGYHVRFDEWLDTIDLFFNGTQLASFSQNNINNSTWHSVAITKNGTNIKVTYDGSQVINYTDISRTLSGTKWGLGGWSGGFTDNHRVRNFVVSQTIAGNVVKVGNNGPLSTMLVVDNAIADPTSNLASLNGGLFYNSTSNKLSIVENGQVKVLCNTTDLGCGSVTPTSQTKVVAMGSPTGCTGSVPVASLDTNADYVVNSCTSAQTTINTAITALGTTGGTVYLKEGTYIVDGAINMASNVSLAGSGYGTVVKLKNSAGGINMISASSVNRISIKDLKLDGNRTNNTGSTGISLSSVGSGSGSSAVPGVKIDKVSIEAFVSNGIFIGAAIHNSSLTNSTVLNNGSDGISSVSSTDNFVVSDNTLQGNGGKAINFNSGPNKSSITNNLVQGNGAGGLEMDFASNSTISGNTITGNSSNGFSGQGSTNLNISGNTISTNTGSGISLLSGGSNTFSSNAISGNGSQGVNSNGETKDTFNGNSIISNSSYGIVIANGTLDTISGNTISANGNNGIYFQQSNSQNLVNGNNITTNSGNGIELAFISSSTNISANTIQNNTGNGILVGSASSQDNIDGNKIYNNGGSGSSNGITVGVPGGTASDKTAITNNQIIDTAGTGFAIDLACVTCTIPTNTYLANNIFSGTGATSIRDSGSTTIYANQVNNNGDFVFEKLGGGFAIGALTATASLTLQGGETIGALSAPAQPGVAPQGTTGATTWGYKITALDGLGETAGSTERQIANGNATLNGTNFNTITWTAIAGAVHYKIYRTTAGGSPATTGLIGTVAGNITSFNDTGIAATTAVPTSNSSGGISVQGNATFKPTTDSATAFQIENSSAAVLLAADTSAMAINIGGNLTVTGNSLVKATSSSAFQVQDSAGTNTLFAADTSAWTLTVSGTTTTFANLTLSNAHFKSTQTTAPTIGTPANCGTTPTAAVTAGSTDSAGSFTITTGTGALAPGTCDTVFTFNKTYGAAPKSIIVTPGGVNAASKAVYVSGSSATTFTVMFGTPAAINSETNTFYYWVVE